MRVYIPSAHRADERVLRSPAAQLKKYVPYWVVPVDQVTAYIEALERHGVPGVVLGCAETGIARTRYWIANHAWLSGDKTLVMLDDDIGFLVRRSDQTWQLRATEPDEADEAIDWLEAMLSPGTGYDHAGLSAREGNNRAGVGGKDLHDKNTRMLRVLAYRTDRLLSMQHGRVTVMEDFDISLQLLRSGGQNIVSYWWAQGQRMTNEPGGCSTYRTHAVHEESARKLAELHPGLVRLRQKENKTDREGFGTRTEVTISWKKAVQVVRP